LINLYRGCPEISRLFKLISHDENGSAVVEVAIMMPLLLMLIFGSIMFIQAYRTQVVLDTAAREAAREYAVTHDSSEAREKAEIELMIGGINPDETNIITRVNDFERQVIIEMNYRFQVPFAGKYNPVLRGTASFHREPEPEYW
jgi:hypothetical protein